MTFMDDLHAQGVAGNFPNCRGAQGFIITQQK